MTHQLLSTTEGCDAENRTSVQVVAATGESGGRWGPGASGVRKMSCPCEVVSVLCQFRNRIEGCDLSDWNGIGGSTWWCGNPAADSGPWNGAGRAGPSFARPTSSFPIAQSLWRDRHGDRRPRRRPPACRGQVSSTVRRRARRASACTGERRRGIVGVPRRRGHFQQTSPVRCHLSRKNSCRNSTCCLIYHCLDGIRVKIMSTGEVRVATRRGLPICSPVRPPGPGS
ncbi:hypothetical protein SAMN05421595_1668 [Austwickia chelonae]|nr:hypothetical protein SAMN05421595_1668 [Austwickia chelonae]